MLRLRLILLGMFVVGGVVSASAVASPVWWVNGAKLNAGQSVRTVSEGGPYTWRAAGVIIGWTMECGREEDVGVLFGGSPGTDEDTIQFTQCIVIEPSGCKALEPIRFDTETELTFLIQTAAGQPWKTATQAEWEATSTADRRFGDLFKPSISGSPFVSLHFTGGECFFAGEFVIEGTDSGLIEESSETNGESLEFTLESSRLTFGGKQASLTGTTKQEVVNSAGGRTGEKLDVKKE